MPSAKKPTRSLPHRPKRRRGRALRRGVLVAAVALAVAVVVARRTASRTSGAGSRLASPVGTPFAVDPRPLAVAEPAVGPGAAASVSSAAVSSSAAGSGRGWSSWRRIGLVATVAFGLLTLGYVIDLVSAGGVIPRGVSVAGTALGGLDRSAADQRLREQLTPRLDQPIALRSGEVSLTMDPRAVGLTLDWTATLDRAAAQPLNPWIRLRSLFATREVGVVVRADAAALSRSLQALRSATDRAPVEGGIRFEGARPMPTEPAAGQSLDLAAAAAAVEREWAFGRQIVLPVSPVAPTVTADGLRAALEQVARPAVASGVTVQGEGQQATLSPEQLAAALSFAPDRQGGLTPTIDKGKIVDVVRPLLAATGQPARDATISLDTGQPVVTPSQDGRDVDYDRTLAGLLDVLRRPTDRTITAVYTSQPAALTTEQVGTLGIREVIGEFTTGGFAADSGMNIRRVAERVNGAIVAPGQTFSLNGYTGPRGAAQGYVAAGIIENGVPGRGVGGGISQFATTLYNASYFAGMADVEHAEHSFYISRYPVAREATVFEGKIDLVFRNDGSTGVLIQTVWTPSSITVRLWGTKRYDVTSTTGPRTNFTSGSTRTLPAGARCRPSGGINGFTATDTRTLRELQTGAIRQETRTVTYQPAPNVVCGTD